MATDFNKNATSTGGGFKPSVANTPLDVRTRVATETDILLIPYPYIGMVVYVEDTGKRFEVLSLKDKKVGMTTQKLAAVKEYREIKVSYNDLTDKPEIPSIEGLATEEFVEEKIAEVPQYDDSELREMIENIEVPSVEGLASEEFVQQEIAKIEHPTVDLEPYAKKEDLFNKDYNELVNKPEIPSIEGLASEEFVQQQIEAIEFPDAYDDTELRGMIEAIEIPEVPSVEGLASEEFVQQQIAAIEIPEVPAYQFKINTVEYGVEPSVDVEGVYPNLVFTFNMPSCIPPEPEIVGRMWYGYIPYDETGVNGVMEPDQVNENMKRSDMEFGIAAGSLIEADPGVLSKYKLNAPDCAFICTIVPNESNLVGLVDDGVGNKVKFADMDISSGLAQDDCILVNQIDGVSYRMSGLYVTNGGGFYTIYIEEK